MLAVSLAQDETIAQLSSSVLCVPHTLALTIAPLLSVLRRPQILLPLAQYRQLPPRLIQVRKNIILNYALINIIYVLPYFYIAIKVTIEITYSSPGTYPVYSPPNYRTASAVTLQCVASGYSGSISYHWTSTCSSCFASNSYSQTISDSWLRTGDAGVHTCSVTDGLGNTGSNSTTMSIVGM